MRRWLRRTFLGCLLILWLAILLLWIRNRNLQVAATPSTAPLQAALARRVTISFSGVMLRDAFEFLRDVTGIKLLVDERALLANKIDTDSMVSVVTLSMQNAPVGVVLATILSATDPRLEFTMEGNGIYISVKDAPRNGEEAERRYQMHPVVEHERKLAQTRPTAPPPPAPIVERIIADRRWTLTADRAHLRLWCTPPDPTRAYQQPVPLGNRSAPDADQVFDAAGLSFRKSDAPFDSWVLSSPYWLLMTLITLPVVAFWILPSLRRRRRVRLGLCPACGYDMRASQGQCPECGRKTSSPLPSAT
jgi:hypothetical protein